MRWRARSSDDGAPPADRRARPGTVRRYGVVPPALRARPRGPVLAAWRQRCLVGQAMALACGTRPPSRRTSSRPTGAPRPTSQSAARPHDHDPDGRGGAGYNSFSRFEQAAGTTVNMHLPRTRGAGEHRSRRPGRRQRHPQLLQERPDRRAHLLLGFAGFTVGPSGVINTGRLTVNTPTREFLIGYQPERRRRRGAGRTAACQRRADFARWAHHDRRPDQRQAWRHAARPFGQHRRPDHPPMPRRRTSANGAAATAPPSPRASTPRACARARRWSRARAGIEIVAAGTVSVSGRLSANARAARRAGRQHRDPLGQGHDDRRHGEDHGHRRRPLASSERRLSRRGQHGRRRQGLDHVGRGHRDRPRCGRRCQRRARRRRQAGSAIVFAGTHLDVADGAVFRGTAGTSGDGGFLELSARTRW